MLYNGLGRHDLARDAARRAFESDHVGAGPFVIPELAEAASRTGDVVSESPGAGTSYGTTQPVSLKLQANNC